MNIRNFDLNLLIVFKELFFYRSVSKVAINLGMSQPAVSHALKRLRESLGDELFFRTNKTLVTTPRAEYLAPIISEYLEVLETNLFKTYDWEPKKSNKIFVFSGTSYDSYIWFPKLMEGLKNDAPLIKSGFKGIVIEKYLERMISGEVDLSFAANLTSFTNFTIETLGEWDLCIIANRKSRKYPRNITLDQYLSAEQILYSPTEKPGSEVDVILGDLGKKRNICIETSYLNSIPALVIHRDYLASVPRFFAERVRKYFPIKILEPPFKIPPFKHQMIWHKSKDNLADHIWLRDYIRENYFQFMS